MSLFVCQGKNQHRILMLSSKRKRQQQEIKREREKKKYKKRVNGYDICLFEKTGLFNGAEVWCLHADSVLPSLEKVTAFPEDLYCAPL